MDLKKSDGTARAFFNCNAKQNVIRREIKNIRLMVEVPDAVRLTLGAIKKVHPHNDLLLSDEIKNALAYNIKYSLKATYPGATNEAAAVELVAIMNQAYQSPLYNKGDYFVGQIFYEKGGKSCYMK